MPDRYWVGGTASWDGTAGTKWSATSGGPGGASVPTDVDDVFFNASSGTGTVTIATGNTGARSINCTGFAGTIAGTAAITVAGSVTLSSAMNYTHTGTMTFTGSGTLITAGKTFSGVTVDMSTSSLTLTLGDALNISTRTITVTRGGFNTAGFSVTANAIVSSNSNTRAITLGASTLTLNSTSTAWNTGLTTGLTFSAGTSSIFMSTLGAVFTGGGLTFHNVSFTSSTAGTREISGANTFNNLTFVASATGLSELSLGASQTVNGTFTCAGSSAIARGFVRSSILGTTRTITTAAISANDCDFRDITLSGAAAGASPTRAGDCGGNSGITFPAAKTVYRVGIETTWGGSSSWATTSGGAGGDGNFPLAQDIAVIDEGTTLTGTLNTTGYNISTVDAATRVTTITLAHAAAANRHGSYTLGSGVTVTGTSSQTFLGRGTMTFTSAGKTITFPITVNSFGGTFQLGDAFNSSNTITLTRGTLNANNYNLTCTQFTSSSSNPRTITMGSGLWTLSGTGTVSGSAPWTLAATGLTFNKDTADILLSDNTTTSRTFFGGGLSYNKLTIGGNTSSSSTFINGVNSFTELASTKTVAHTVRLADNLGTIDTWSITGASGRVVDVNSNSVGTRRTFNLTNVTSGINFLDVRDIGVNQANRFYVGANSTNSGNNLNVIFTAAPAINVTVPVTGVSSTGQVGTAEAFDVVDVPVTGIEASGQVGAVEAVGEAIVSATGVGTSGQVGSVVASESLDVAVTGVQAAGQVGQVIIPNVDVSVTGVATTGQVGAVTAISDVVVSPTGITASGQVGTAVAIADVLALAEGVSATGEAGAADATGDANLALTGVVATGGVGTVQAIPSVEVPVTGLSATAAVGSVVATGSAIVVQIGVSATGRVGQVTVWGAITPDPGSTWTEVDPSATNTWTEVSPSPGTTWNPVAA